MTAYGYIRVSSKEQLEGFGLDAQRERLHGWARANLKTTRERDLFAVFGDSGVSGTLLERPSLHELIEWLEPGDVVVVPRLDRLARSLIVQEVLLAQIQECGARVVSCQEGENAYLAEDLDDASLKLIRHMFGAFAEYERAMILQRMQAGKNAKIKAGGYGGGQPPYGWRGGDGVLTEVPEEQLVLKTMRWLDDGGNSYTDTAEILNGQGRARRNGKPWTAGAVRKILARQGTPAGAVGQDFRSEVPREVGDEVVAPAVVKGDGRDHG